MAPDVDTPSSTTRVLEAKSLSKAFPNVQALSGVDLDVRPGEVLALVGENGAGKSTLLRVLSGDYHADAGTLAVDGTSVHFHNPRDAHRGGVRVVYQEPEVIDHVSVAENIYTGELPRRGVFVDRRELRRRVAEDLDRCGYRDALPPDLLGAELSTPQRQLVEIVRALKPGARLVAFDEPTSSLTVEEVDALFALIRRLRAEGLGIIYVSHRLNEIFRIADRIAVLRDGQLIGVRATTATTEDEIVRMMVGRDIDKAFPSSQRTPGEPVLEVKGLSSRWHSGIDLTVHSGEVVALAGLVGAGRTELAKVIFGEYAATGGRIRVAGNEVEIRRPTDAIAAGIGLAPEDRKLEGLVMVRSVAENAALALLRRLSRFGFVKQAEERSTVERFVARLNVRTPSIDQEIGKLSGGNQQKVVLARWLATRPRLLILDEPTRGIDVGAKAEIYRLIDELASDGLGILIISSELTEVLGLADRILVMQNGRLTGELSRRDATEQRILELAMVDSLAGASTATEVQP